MIRFVNCVAAGGRAETCTIARSGEGAEYEWIYVRVPGVVEQVVRACGRPQQGRHKRVVSGADGIPTHRCGVGAYDPLTAHGVLPAIRPG